MLYMIEATIQNAGDNDKHVVTWPIEGPNANVAADLASEVIPSSVKAFAYDLVYPHARYGDVTYTIAAYQPARVHVGGGRENAWSSQLHPEPFRIDRLPHSRSEP